MKKSSKISDEDIALFRKTVGDIKPLKQDSVVLNKPTPSPHPIQSKADDLAGIDEIIDDEYDTGLLERGDELLYARPGVQKQTIRKLRRGQYKIEAELDMHGMTVAMANEALSGFLRQCAVRSHRCVRIIHGKGIGSANRQPVLKNKLNQWLLKSDKVLAFCSARPADGGTGAIYLLLKRK